ncbi:MAG: hypothetical protein IT529_14045 [Burkholderiales bacterium]|nr:hypothetical protein [Burkholderiales bacterium]
MDPPPVLRCKGWDELVPLVSGHPELRPLAGIEPALARALLAAPAALALWIAARMPGRLARGAMRLLVIGAETVDAVDEGRWYAALPALTGTGGEFTVTLLGAELDASFASAAAPLAPARAARCVRVSLARFIETGTDAFDLAVMFHPGLGKHRGWLEDGSLARVIGSGCELVASAYEEDEFEMDRWVLECHGYGVAGDSLVNPYCLDLDHERTAVRWGRVLWGFAPLVPEPGFVPDHGRLADLDMLTRMTMHSVTEVGAPGPDPGAAVELRAQTGARLSLIHIFDHRFVDPATGGLLRLDSRGALEPCGRIAGGELARYPGEAAPPLARAIWAARIKAASLLATYPAPATRIDPAEKARDMYATLRARAEKLFGR